MASLTETLSDSIRAELGVPAIDANIAANMLVGVHWQLFRNARAQALAGRHGPAAVRRLRSDLDRAYRLLEYGLGALEDAGSQGAAGPVHAS
jgi:hypothetical protein